MQKHLLVLKIVCVSFFMQFLTFDFGVKYDPFLSDHNRQWMSFYQVTTSRNQFDLSSVNVSPSNIHLKLLNLINITKCVFKEVQAVKETPYSIVHLVEQRFYPP